MMNQLQTQYKIILIGDSCQDIYEYVTVDRISPEAPVPVCVTQYTETKPGMASNVRHNLMNLGCDVSFYTGQQSKKKRIIDLHSKQHIIRIDNDIISKKFNHESLDYAEGDAIIISDYDKGFLDYEAIQSIIEFGKNQKIPIFIDTKKTDLSKFKDAYVKINELEHKNAKSYNDNMIVTRSSKDVLYKDKSYPVKKIDVADVCGAGDTFISALTYKFLESKDMDSAIEFAIKASAITVQHIGVYAPTLEEI